MKTKAVAFLIPFIAAGFLFASPGQAQQPIPGIQQTAQWRALNDYVSELRAKRKTPATSERKASYRQALKTRRTNANTRVNQLYSERLRRIIGRDKVKERRQIRKYQKASNRQAGKLQGKRSGKIAAAKDASVARVSAIRARYAAALAVQNDQIRKLQKQLRRTKDPFQRTFIKQSITTANNKKDRLRQTRQVDIADEIASRTAQVDSIRRRFSILLERSRSHYRRLIANVESAWRRIYADEVRSLKAQRTSEFQLVTGLNDRGTGYIDEMPPKPVR